VSASAITWVETRSASNITKRWGRRGGFRLRRSMGARKGDAILSAESPLELLGLVAMYNARGLQWQASDAEIDAFLAKVPK